MESHDPLWDDYQAIGISLAHLAKACLDPWPTDPIDVTVAQRLITKRLADRKAAGDAWRASIPDPSQIDDALAAQTLETQP